MYAAGEPSLHAQKQRLNQTLEQYLYSYINKQQNNWVQQLPLAQFAFNSTKSETTGKSPFYANFGYEPKAYR
jgi:hypothetical protein